MPACVTVRHVESTERHSRRKLRLNHTLLDERMVRLGIDNYSALARRVIVNGKPIERSYLSRVLRGQRPVQPSLVLALAEALNCSPVALLGPEDPDAVLAELRDAS